MKFNILLLAWTFGFKASAQNSSGDIINNNNYYKYHQDIRGATTNWLRYSEAVPVIIDQLLKNGIAYHTIGVGRLLEVNDSTRFVVTVYFKKEDKEYGFLYEGTHGIPLNPKDREFMTNDSHEPYLQVEDDIASGKRKFMKINTLPSNIFLLKERCYWFQFDNKGSNFPVSKGMAQNILRQDIDGYLKKL